MSRHPDDAARPALRIRFDTLSLAEARALSREERRARQVAERKLAELRLKRDEHPADRLDRDVMSACERLARAVDTLELATGTPGASKARMAVMRTAQALRRLMRDRGTA